VKINHIFSLRS